MIAAALLCQVVGVADGNTLTVRCGEPGSYQQLKIRLAEFDAPEKAQPFGQRSKQSLSDMCFGTQASIAPVSIDRYKRTLARVTCPPFDTSTEQVRRGMAWSYTKYNTDRQIPRAEAKARAARAGLWIDPEPVAPWAWRMAKKGR